MAVAFGGELGMHAAARFSEAMARAGAMQKAGLWLDTLPGVQMGRTGFEKTDPHTLRDSGPLAWALFSSTTTEQERIGTPASPGVRTTVAAAVSHASSAALREALTAQFRQPVRLMLLRRAMDEEQAILDRFVSLAATMPQSSLQPSAQPSGQMAGALRKEFEPRFAALLNELQAVNLYRDILRNHENGLWQNPETTATAIEQALELAPNSPLLLHAKGTILYQNGKTQPALDTFSRCIDLAPDFAQALHDRGTTYVRIHLTDLAVADYNAALALHPTNPSFLQSRGSAHLLRKDFEAMCSDFREACGLGHCENLHWATSRGHCPGPAGSAASGTP
ncbi:hypothetical protein [Desulfovibrio psychrotolerans]|uniref:Tetratricopeptide repeat protein n=1 Tax=Desulfovibrio psychrotolerans TaxID=415242 RepID=A0A7J0BVA1_9BACT|nr:hypothetical protein [Desulfovibrio psychrotolerans]GFM37085.1 hypothetical protein DSM19430T_17690 [Desulfovibrio psychrotolerans]